MKSLGMTRVLDELGRIVIPKEIRRNLGWNEGDDMEIVPREDGVYLRKVAKSHGDKIRGMNNEELAELFERVISERDHILLEKLKAAGIDAELIEMPAVSQQYHKAWLDEIEEKGK